MSIRKAFWLATGLCGLLSGCHFFKSVEGDGNLLTQTFPVTEYKGLTVHSVSMQIDYVQSEGEPGFQLTTDRNIMDRMEWYVDEDQQLVIRPKKGFGKMRLLPTQFHIIAHSQVLEQVSLAGKVEFNLTSRLESDRLILDLAGDGVFNLNDSVLTGSLQLHVAGNGVLNAPAVACKTLEGDIAGSGKFRLGGSAGDVTLDTAGNMEVEAFDMPMERLACDAVGRLRLEVFVNEKIDVSVVGMHDITYKGNPSFRKEGVGGGPIRQIR